MRLDVDRNRPKVQDHGITVKTELRPSLVTESSVESSARSPYHSKSGKSTPLQPLRPATTVPLIVVSPSTNRRELPKSPPIQITPLQVSVSSRSKPSSTATLSGKREISSSTPMISSSLEVATVTTAVAANADADEDSGRAVRNSGYRLSTGPTIVKEEQYWSDATFVVITSCEVVF